MIRIEKLRKTRYVMGGATIRVVRELLLKFYFMLYTLNKNLKLLDR